MKTKNCKKVKFSTKISKFMMQESEKICTSLKAEPFHPHRFIGVCKLLTNIAVAMRLQYRVGFCRVVLSWCTQRTVQGKRSLWMTNCEDLLEKTGVGGSIFSNPTMLSRVTKQIRGWNEGNEGNLVWATQKQH